MGSFIVELVDIRYQKEDSGWIIANGRSVPDPNSDIGIQFKGLIPIVGVWRSPLLGVPHRVDGEIVNDKRWGKQLSIARGCIPVRIERLISLDGVTRYLKCIKAGIDASRRAKGLDHLSVGPARIRDLVRAYGKEAPAVLREDPCRVVKEVRGWTEEQAEVFSEHLKARVDEEMARVELATIGAGALSQSMVDTLYLNFGSEAPSVLRSDPYKFAHGSESADERYVLDGFGWSRADHIARANLGWHRTDPRRLMAAITEALKKNTESGDTWMRRKECIFNSSLISGEIPRYHAELIALAPITITDDDRLYLSSLWDAENKVAKYVLERRPACLQDEELEDDDQIQRGLNMLQRSAYRLAMRGGLSIMTGGPGRGKTHTIKSILEGLRVRGRSAILLAPTGRAAARAQEVTGAKTSTIHRMVLGGIEASSTDFIVDEMSMVDIALFARLIDHINSVNPRANLLLVGDPDQLPPVQPGRPFVDLILSGIVPIVKLEQVMRTDRKGIIDAATAVNELGPEDIIAAFDGVCCDSFEYFDASGEDARKMVLDRVRKLVADGVSAENIQVVTATNGYNASSGSARLNSSRDLNSPLGEILNPNGEKIAATASGEELAVGDRVMQLKNDRKIHNAATMKEMFVANGEIGVVQRMRDGRLVVDFGVDSFGCQRLADIHPRRNDLRKSWAATCHKFQGSEAHHVIIVFDKSSGRIVDRSWIYTAITRASESVSVFAPQKAVERACKGEARVMRRRSGLAELLSRGAELSASSVSVSPERIDSDERKPAI